MHPKAKKGLKVLGHMCHALHHQPGIAYEPKASQLRGMAKAQEETREGLPEKKPKIKPKSSCPTYSVSNQTYLSLAQG